MSNAEKMVSVPRQVAEQAAYWLEVHSERSSVEYGVAEDLREALSKPAEQRQGEPVALPARQDEITQSYCDCLRASGFNSCLDEIAKLGPLYTHADAGEVESLKADKQAFAQNAVDLRAEVEKLREGISKHWKVVCDQRAELDTLRAQLAEQDVLLRDLVRDSMASDFNEHWDSFKNAERAIISSTEPSAPVERDERAEFEAEWSLRRKELKIKERGNEFYRVQPNDLYRWHNVQDSWEMWQARAALERKP